tara:strand:- start:4803 stop:5018 length:216 start_codon:yes stop_codon:yes gene_type:complete
MSKIQRDRDHLIYAAVHQDKDSYIQALKIHNQGLIIHSITSIVKVIAIGVIITFSDSDVLPAILALIKNFN